MECEEKTRLFTAYSVASSVLRGAISRQPFKSDAEFRKGLAVLVAAREECVKAQRALQAHRVEHQC